MNFQYSTIYIHQPLYYLSFPLFVVSEPPQSYGFLNNPSFHHSHFALACPTYGHFYRAMHYLFPDSLGVQNNLDGYIRK